MAVIAVAVGFKLSQTTTSPSRSNSTTPEPDEPGWEVKRLVHVALHVHTP
ncbi:hypothetical protein [Microtetraspora malaysiensis]|uniref:Uncharacterized protein n=1 Tax=Microtetraspora malaysiensis TaxID=161358 RepID=A0ABW6T411_9ACTN